MRAGAALLSPWAHAGDEDGAASVPRAAGVVRRVGRAGFRAEPDRVAVCHEVSAGAPGARDRVP